MSVYNLIKKRRSIRHFSDKSVGKSKIIKILDAARWAPSGLNNQPWRFVVIYNKKLKARVSKFTKYSFIISRASSLILVFLDRKSSYNPTKDAMAIGASIQNMLLCTEEQGLSSCWLGEILNQKQKVNKLLKIKRQYDLMAAIALGYSSKKAKSMRMNLDKLILKEL